MEGWRQCHIISSGLFAVATLGACCTIFKLNNSLKLVRLPMVLSNTRKSLCGMQNAACCGDQQVCTADCSCCALQPQAQASCKVHHVVISNPAVTAQALVQQAAAAAHSERKSAQPCSDFQPTSSTPKMQCTASSHPPCGARGIF